MITKSQLEFLEYHNASPDIYEAYSEYAFMLHNAGISRKSISMITERIRWRTATGGTGAFKIKNSCRAGYARLLMWREPKLVGSFLIHRSYLDGLYPLDLKDCSTWNSQYWDSFK